MITKLISDPVTRKQRINIKISNYYRDKHTLLNNRLIINLIIFRSVYEYGHIHKLLNVLPKTKVTHLPGSTFLKMAKKLAIVDRSKFLPVVIKDEDSSLIKIGKVLWKGIPTMYPKTVDVLKQGLEYGLIRYEDTTELKEAGSLKLTQRGYQLYKLYVETTYGTKIPFDIPCNDILHFKVGLLQVASDSLITLPYQTHLVVAFDYKNGQIYGIGLLTSEKGNFLLSESQITAKDKIQYLRRFKNLLLIEKSQFTPHNAGTVFINEPEILHNLKKIPLNYTKMDYYNSKGITKTELMELIKMNNAFQDIENEKKALEKPLTEEQNKKALIKKEKATLNTLKQKETNLKKLYKNESKKSD